MRTGRSSARKVPGNTVVDERSTLSVCVLPVLQTRTPPPPSTVEFFIHSFLLAALRLKSGNSLGGRSSERGA